MDDYFDWADWDNQASEYLGSSDYLGGNSYDYTPSADSLYLSDSGIFNGLHAPISYDYGSQFALDPNTGGFLRDYLGNPIQTELGVKNVYDPATLMWQSLGSTEPGLDQSPPELRGIDFMLMNPDERKLYVDALRNPLTGELPGDVAEALDFYKSYYDSDPTKSPYTGTTSTSYQGKNADAIMKAGGAGASGGASNKSAFDRLKDAYAERALKQLASRNKFEDSSVGALAKAAQLAALVAQAAKGNTGIKMKARESTVQDTGPKFQAAKPVRTLYAKGGKIELPTDVKGGLLPITMKLVEHAMGNKGLISGEEGGQDDVVDIKAAPGEYVMDAEVVSMLGDGNNKAGAKKLDEMRYNIRKHKRSGGLAQIAEKAKKPEQYMKGK